MAFICTCVDSPIEELTRHSFIGYGSEWKPVLEGLKFLRTFLTYIPKWSDVDEHVRQHLGDLVNSIEDAFATAGSNLGDAIQRGEEDDLNAVHSKLLETIELFKPKIRETYNYLSEYAFQSHSPVTDFNVWDLFHNCVQRNASDIQFEAYMVPLNKQSGALLQTLQQLRDLISLLATEDNLYPQFRHFWTHVGGVAICSARLMYLCWVDKIDIENAQDMAIMLSDLQHKIKPVTKEVMDVYFEAMKSATTHSRKYVSTRLVYTLLPSKIPAEILFEGLTLLTELLVFTPDNQAEDVELISTDIRRVISEAGSLNYSSSKGSEAELALFQLLQKIELLKVELVLMQIINSRIKLEVPAEKQFESIHKGVRFLQTFFKHPQANTEKVTLISTHIETVTGEARSLYSSFDAKQITEDIVRDALKLLLKVKLLKADQAFLMELMNCNNSLMVLVKDQIETLHGVLEFLRNFLSGPLQENPNDGKFILTSIDVVATEAMSLYYFFDFKQVSENTTKEMTLLLSNLLERSNLVKAEVQNIYLQVRSSSSLTFPKTNGMGFVDFFLENLRQRRNCKADLVDYMQSQIETVLKELESLRSFLDGTAEQCNEDVELKNLYMHVTDVAYKADYIIDSILLKNGAVWYHMLWLSDVIEEIKVIKAKEIKIIKQKQDSTGVQNAAQTSRPVISQTTTPEDEEVTVALEDQEKIIVDQLTRGSSRREVVSIVGMPGIGKTTLAKEVYDSPAVKDHFHIQAWCCVSQAYRRRELLLKILSDFNKLTDEFHNKTDEDLLEIIYKSLKRNRYLIVMDDVWGIQAWNDLGSAFPDDSNGSRILFTSRYDKVVLEAQPDCPPNYLRFLNEVETWKLLQEKVFREEGCPEELLEVGRAIATSCKGLPLAVVAIAGLLKRTEKKVDRWNQIAEDLNSRILEDPESQCLYILELSYHHLPDDLKPCFLYFGAFGEDQEVPVRKLIRLWIAEGFIREVDQKALLEDVAQGYLMDLIGRSLVMASRRGSDGRVKACQVHDMIHNLCLTKVRDENFMQSITGYDKLFPSSAIRLDYGVDSDYRCPSISYDQHRLSICSKRNQFVMLKPSGPCVRSLLYSATNDKYPRCPYDISFISCNFKLLRVLDIESINMGSSFPKGIELLDPLRYLAISGDIDSIPSTIVKLWNLEVFIVKGLKGKVALPANIWSMTRLRHLHVNSNAIFILQDKSLESSSQLDNLVTLSSPTLSYGEDSEKILKKFIKLRKLKCTFSESPQHSGNCNHFPVLDFLTELESLKIFYYGGVRHSSKFNFPLKLQKLSLADFILSWDCISSIGTLPELEVLKLASIAFDSPTWEMKEDEFLELKFLKLDSMGIAQWKASSGHLPKLQRLVLRSCKQLQEVPFDFGEINTLQMIELHWCSSSAENSVRAIQEEQIGYGNDGFKVIINVPDMDFRSSFQ